MQPFQQRVVDEERDLNDKIEKLTAFIPTELFKRLPPAEQDRMKNQLMYMGRYASILRQRIEAFDNG